MPAERVAMRSPAPCRQHNPRTASRRPHATGVDRLTGEIREAQIFVAVMGASSFSYAQATWTQGLGDWIAAHIGALEAIGGAPRLLSREASGLRRRRCARPWNAPGLRACPGQYRTI